MNPPDVLRGTRFSSQPFLPQDIVSASAVLVRLFLFDLFPPAAFVLSSSWAVVDDAQLAEEEEAAPAPAVPELLGGGRGRLRAWARTDHLARRIEMDSMRAWISSDW